MVALLVFVDHLPYLGKLPGGLMIPGLNDLRTDSIEGGNNWAGVLFICAIYVLVAIGLNVVVGLAGLLDLGYIGFFAIGAYTRGALRLAELAGRQVDPAGVQPAADLGGDLGDLLLLAIVLTMMSGVMLGAPTLRLRGDYLAIVTLGFGEIIRIVARNATGVTNGAGRHHGHPGARRAARRRTARSSV